MALSNEKERELLSSLNSAYNRFNKLEEQNRQIKRRNEELAKQTLEGQKYFRSVEKYEKRRSRNLQTRRMIVAACITLAAVVVLLIATITAWQIVVGNLSAIKAPFADNDQSGWTDEQYGVLYTLGILLFVAVVIGLIAASIGGTMSKKSINILGWAYIALGIAAYIGLIIY